MNNHILYKVCAAALVRFHWQNCRYWKGAPFLREQNSSDLQPKSHSGPNSMAANTPNIAQWEETVREGYENTCLWNYRAQVNANRGWQGASPGSGIKIRLQPFPLEDLAQVWIEEGLQAGPHKVCSSSGIASNEIKAMTMSWPVWTGTARLTKLSRRGIYSVNTYYVQYMKLTRLRRPQQVSPLSNDLCVQGMEHANIGNVELDPRWFLCYMITFILFSVSTCPGKYLIGLNTIQVSSDDISLPLDQLKTTVVESRKNYRSNL